MITTTHKIWRNWATFTILFAGLFPIAAHADTPTRPFLNPLFTDNMVLQRGQADPIWGWTTAGANVTVRIAGKSASALAGPDGKWMTKIGPIPAGGPYTLTVTGPQVSVLHNILVGDVWICSGQSNMEFGVGNLLQPQAVIAGANVPNLRLFTVSKGTALTPQVTTDGQWQVCTPETIQSQGTWNGFSAVGYFFGRNLSRNQHVPIGLLLSSFGGTAAEAWTSASALTQHVPDFRDKIAALDRLVQEQRVSGPTTQSQITTTWYQANDPGSASGLGWADPAYNDSSWLTLRQPGYWQQAGVPSLASVNGIGWFRKEINLSANEANKAAVLRLLADDNDTAWVNGTLVGDTEGYQTPRAYPIPAGLLRAGRNIIAVRVLDTGGSGGLWGTPDDLRLDVSDASSISLAGPWQFRLSKPLAALPSPPFAIFNNANFPSELYNAMISPLIPFGVKGVIWYQGENNAYTEAQATQYRTLLPTLIADWRGRWGEGPFPFLIVQLAGYAPAGPAWPEMREAQALTARTVPGVGLMTATDIGDPSDIHPKNKQEVGRRLALVAEAQVYHEKVVSSGPVYKTMWVQGGTVRLAFRMANGGLVAKGGILSGFTVAGMDRNFVPADAVIHGDAVIVSSPQVAAPVAVRYAWAPYPAMSLYNAAGLPAFPFRTDHWTGVIVRNNLSGRSPASKAR